MKNVKIWLLPLRETFVDDLSTSDIHSNNLNFVSSKREWFFQNTKIDSFPKEKIFPFGKNYWQGFCGTDWLCISNQVLYKNLEEATKLIFYFL